MKTSQVEKYFVGRKPEPETMKKPTRVWQDSTKHTGHKTSELSLNITGDSLEGYNLFTDSSYENGQDLVKNIKGELMEFKPVKAQISPKNNFINRKSSTPVKTITNYIVRSQSKKKEKDSRDCSGHKKSIYPENSKNPNNNLHFTGQDCRSTIRELHSKHIVRLESLDKRQQFPIFEKTTSGTGNSSSCQRKRDQDRIKPMEDANSIVIEERVKRTNFRKKDYTTYSKLCSLVKDNILKQSRGSIQNIDKEEFSTNRRFDDLTKIAHSSQNLLTEAVKTIKASMKSRKQGESLSLEAMKRGISSRSLSRNSQKTSVINKNNLVKTLQIKVIEKDPWRNQVSGTDPNVSSQNNICRQTRKIGSHIELEAIKSRIGMKYKAPESEHSPQLASIDSSRRSSLFLESRYCQSSAVLDDNCVNEYYPWLTIDRRNSPPLAADRSSNSVKAYKKKPVQSHTARALVERLQSALSSSRSKKERD